VITAEINERLTQTAAGTPAGALLRMYWHPVGTLVELEKEPVQPVRVLSENLTLFRDLQGNIGLIGERCAHRAISLAYGIPQGNGLRCAYHGWTYNTDGKVVNMPFEPACLPLKVKSYPVEEMGGLIWAYLGPQPAPLVPRFQGYVRDDVDRTVDIKPLPCNWLQCMDNSMDPVHFEHLHAHYGNYYNSRNGKAPGMRTPRHVKIDFDIFEYGIMKRRLLEGQSEDADDWTHGHPVLFPNTLQVNGANDGSFMYQIRTPIDDTHTMHYVYTMRPHKAGEAPREFVATREQVMWNELGLVNAPMVIQQDEMAWIGQGPISDRTQEHLATSDKGIIVYHNLILSEIEKVARGEDPIGVVRDAAMNNPMINVGIEGEALTPFGLTAEAIKPRE
jgi:5,5'-dehydrodivanillate O-demethylase oxygenase subunit